MDGNFTYSLPELSQLNNGRTYRLRVVKGRDFAIKEVYLLTNHPEVGEPSFSRTAK
jgi:hypothetical protein